MKNILIINAHSFNNKGDAAIIISMLKSLRKYNEGSKISILTRDVKSDKIYLQYGADEINEALISFKQDVSKIRKITSFISDIFNIILKNKKSLKAVKAYKDADIVVSCGGCFLYSKEKNKLQLTILNHFIQIYYAILLRKHTVIYAQSIGPFKNKIMDIIAKKVLKKVDIIFAREHKTELLLKEMGLKNVRICADSAFNLPVESISLESLIGIKEKMIAITVRQWDFPGEKYGEKLYDKYIRSVADVINYSYEQYGIKSILVPQVIGPNRHEDDRIAFNDLKKYIKKTNYYNDNLLNYDFTPGQIKSIYSQCLMLVGTRMHSNIFALAKNIPVLAIAYEHKTNGIMEMFELSDFVVNIEDIDSEIAIKILTKIMKDYENIEKRIYKKNIDVKEMVELPAKEINNILLN